jgi:hypothetical protein
MFSLKINLLSPTSGIPVITGTQEAKERRWLEPGRHSKTLSKKQNRTKSLSLYTLPNATNSSRIGIQFEEELGDP